MTHVIKMDVAGRCLTLETGRMAKQANGAVLASYGDIVVLATVVASQTVKPGADFLPLTVNYQEKAYAVGKIPGGYFKREGIPSEKEVLTSRLIDRPLRPLFPGSYYLETQVIVSVISADETGLSDMVGMIAASAALAISDIPFDDPIAGVRIGRINDQFVINPDLKSLEKGDLNLIVAGTAEAVMMVEGEGKELPETVLIQAIQLAHTEIKEIVCTIRGLRAIAGRLKRSIVSKEIDPKLAEIVQAFIAGPLREAVLIPDRTARQERIDQIISEVMERLKSDDPDYSRQVKQVFASLEYQEVRTMMLEQDARLDGRGPADIRAITCEVGVLPRTHGSALFTRGETQSLVVVTLGSSEDEQQINALEGKYHRKFFLHYNFPPFSVGEAKPLRPPGRREIGHGSLAARALKAVLPGQDVFPYTVRIVSDILESNGSSSMATVCGGTLALMDAGVPITAPVAGIAMGLIKEGDGIMMLSDILGLEDHVGDMDLKIAGTQNGITALQMDIKIAGITLDLIRQAMEQARRGRLHILDRMAETLAAPRSTLSSFSPRMMTFTIKAEKVRDVIGPGGKMIRSISAQYGVKINVEDGGGISIAAIDEASARKAMEMIRGLTEDAEVGKLYQGTVKKIMDFGAIVEILPGKEGLVHISQLAHYRVETVSQEVTEGDQILVKVLEIDRQGKIRLSRKAAMVEMSDAPDDQSKDPSLAHSPFP